MTPKKRQAGAASGRAGRTLGVAHLALQLIPSLPDAALPSLVLTMGADRETDRFMEVHIFGMVPIDIVERVSLDRPLVTAESQGEWDLARQKIVARGIPVEDRSSP